MSLEYCPYTNSSPPMCYLYKKIPVQLVKALVDCNGDFDKALRLLEKHGWTVVSDNF